MQRDDFPPVSTNANRNPHFLEMRFMRVSSWQESKRDVTLLGGPSFGGRIFYRYHWPFMNAVTMDFFCRGYKLSDIAAESFRQILSYQHGVAESELSSMEEILSVSVLLDQYENQFEHAQVGVVNGRNLLAIQWSQIRLQQKRISIYFDAYGDGKTVREIHFSAPFQHFDSMRTHFSDTVRSIQWEVRASAPVLRFDSDYVESGRTPVSYAL